MESKKWLLIANAAVSLIVAGLVGVIWPGAFTNVEQYFLGLLILIALTAVESAYIAAQSLSVNQVAVKQMNREIEIWEARSELDLRLQEVRRLFHKLEEERLSEVDLFCSYHDRKLADLEASLRDALSKRQVQIDETMFAVTDWLLASTMKGRKSDVLRAVFPLTSADFFFDVHTRRYFTQVWRLIQTNQSAGVRRLVTYDDPNRLKDVRLQRLIAFHQAVVGYEIKAIDSQSFGRYLRDYRIHHLILDFGIYGIDYLYKALKNDSDEIVGLYSRDSREIELFTACFDGVWESAHPLPRAELELPARVAPNWVFDNSDTG